MKIPAENAESEARIEMLPLIDVVFCILIFFILATLQLTRQSALDITLPQSSTSRLQERQTLLISLDAAGQPYVDSQPVTPEQLRLVLVGFNRTNPNGSMLLYADGSAAYRDIVTVLDAMRAVGGDRVALATEPADLQRSPQLVPTPLP
ncbi:ExbD/TolR family protein [Synechococcus elongatus]|uniref:Biopolymer transport ExbD like protein n=2 Tax=Synechococcus elongatus TaxID=32046 RepID=Q31KG1_SYNE7|nr:biopolymer transporter ExbD [Synechococcus elongatus]ABB58458.1 biopolymer transport ExbD like protein [Synechococcus elongatus PCC 7942 = FACHB-805]AJD57081.1 biopolymer transporter ExbD [Synechococcus elongatus UTEX 2973]MBD2587178.1 biopolymer transporter ExbD [Synechococcus elongatus FACHB-242]MBD2688249.1 biopolymer transporter ExbD [Synechococcus elongatus FACHB-1061]MBD2706040.1 biopolymer transporter ExbD [Synechococcus elongatus PCC 7942 = FACHB-805]